jgi:hypothetical protein
MGKLACKQVLSFKVLNSKSQIPKGLAVVDLGLGIWTLELGSFLGICDLRRQETPNPGEAYR